MKVVTVIAVETEDGDHLVLGAAMREAMRVAGAISANVICFDADHRPRKRQREGLERLFGKRETGRLFDGTT